jgi:hypothetical protein
MAATTLRVDDPRVKEEFDRVQAELALRRGRRPSQTEVLAELLEAFRAGDANRSDDAWKPFTKDERRALRRARAHGGSHAPAENLDKLLYGGDAP